MTRLEPHGGLPIEVFPIRLTALLGWPRASFTEAMRRLMTCETEDEFHAATAFIQEVSYDLADCQRAALLVEWKRVDAVFMEQRELRRMVRDVYE